MPPAQLLVDQWRRKWTLKPELALHDLAQLPGGCYPFSQHPAAVWLTDAAAIRAVLLNADADFVKDAVPPVLRPYLGDGTAASAFGRGQGLEEWRSQKKSVLVPALGRFQATDLEWKIPVGAGTDFYATLHDALFAQVWQRGWNRILLPHHQRANRTLRRTATDVVWALGKQWPDIFRFNDRALGRDWAAWRFLPSPHIRGLKARRRAIRLLLSALLAVEKADAANEGWGDLLHRVLADEESDSQLRFSLVGLLSASYENSASVGAWMLWLLAQHPEWQERLRAEAGDEKEGLQAVLNETLRLFPPVWSVARIAQNPVKLAGVTLEAGTCVFISAWAQGRSPFGWKQPMEFRPERWRQTTTERGYFLPFGFGGSGCPGEAMARAQILSVTASLLQQWRFVPCESKPAPHPLFTLTQRPENGVWLKALPLP